MTTTVKERLPLIFLAAVSVFWAIYYQQSNAFNDFGRANYEWLYLLDGLIVLPLLCYFCYDDKKTAFIKILLYSCLVIFIGSFIIPQSSKSLWLYLESLRYVVLVVFLFVEISVIATIILAIRSGLDTEQDPDAAISQPIEKLLGAGTLAKLIAFEARVWCFFLLANKIKPERYTGRMHFQYHRKDGAQSNSLGFIILIAAELPLVHLLLHYTWSPLAAAVASLLSLVGLIFMVADYRAMSRRPISITQSELIIRYGILNAYFIKITNIARVELHDQHAPRSKTSKRFRYAGNPNIAIHCRNPQSGIDKIYVAVDQPQSLISALQTRMNSVVAKNS